MLATPGAHVDNATFGGCFSRPISTDQGAENMPEIIEVLRRCTKCGGALRVLLGHTYFTHDGKAVYAEWSETAPHTLRDCNRLVTLTREEWPTLW
jgi:hypothetical protein